MDKYLSKLFFKYKILFYFTFRKFDLKGSTVDREASDKEKEKDLPTFKDNDFVKERTKIYIGDEAKDKLLETLGADVDVSVILMFYIFSFLKHVNFAF